MPTYEESRFWTTHNSYSGGPRRSIVEQLDAKVRWIEFDVHDTDFVAVGDYRLGHLRPGMEVALGNGNPKTLLLRDWLDVIAEWSARTPPPRPRHSRPRPQGRPHRQR